MTNVDDLVGYGDAATLLGVNVSTLRWWVHVHRVPHIRFGIRTVRFRRSELLEFIDRGRVGSLWVTTKEEAK